MPTLPSGHPSAMPTPSSSYPSATHHPPAIQQFPPHLWGPSPLWTPPSLQAPRMWTPGHTLPVFALIFRKRKIGVCNGCKGNFAKQPAAPHDLVIQHQVYWMYTLPDGTVKHKYVNLYYHPTLPRICAKQPDLNATQIVVSQVVKDQATLVHRKFILAMIVVNI